MDYLTYQEIVAISNPGIRTFMFKTLSNYYLDMKIRKITHVSGNATIPSPIDHRSMMYDIR